MAEGVGNTGLSSLKKLIEPLGSAVIAYSGGADSAFLLKAALDALGYENVVAVTADSPIRPPGHLEEAERISRMLGARHMTLKTGELSDPGFCSNPEDRCYLCKRGLFSSLQKIREKMGFGSCIDGSNSDDASDYRPGGRAAEELGVKSPLKEAGITKSLVRSLSREAGLPTWDKPSYACLAAGIPYGQEITPGKLSQISRAEKFLRDLGLSRARLRHHGDTARVEVRASDIALFAESALREKTVGGLKSLGFTYICLDLEGYRTGSMNEVLK